MEIAQQHLCTPNCESPCDLHLVGYVWLSRVEGDERTKVSLYVYVPL